MPLYMSQFSYTSEAWAALTRNPEDRSAAVGALAEALGGRMISFYYSFGEYDGVIIGEYPDEATAAAGALAGIMAGHLKAIKTTTLLSVEDTMEAMRRAGEAAFRGPRETLDAAPPGDVPRETSLGTPVTPPEDAVPPDVPSPPGEERSPRPAP